MFFLDLQMKKSNHLEKILYCNRFLYDKFVNLKQDTLLNLLFHDKVNLVK